MSQSRINSAAKTTKQLQLSAWHHLRGVEWWCVCLLIYYIQCFNYSRKCQWNTYCSVVAKTLVFLNLYIEILIIGQRSLNQHRNDNLAKYIINVSFVYSSAIFFTKMSCMKCCIEAKCEKGRPRCIYRLILQVHEGGGDTAFP